MKWYNLPFQLAGPDALASLSLRQGSVIEITVWDEQLSGIFWMSI